MIIIQRPIKVSSIIKVSVAGLIALKNFELATKFWWNLEKFFEILGKF